MKRKINLFVVFALACLCLVTITFVVLAIDGEGTDAATITISYMKTQETTSDTRDLDTVAYENGKQIVGIGERFTLPTTANASYVNEEGFQLVWYTEDGRTYKAGEEVSFDKDTKLFRCVAKEVYTMSELNFAMTKESGCAILMTDITTTEHISVWDQGQSVLVLNGFTMNITRNGDIMGTFRSGNHVYGTGTMNITSTDGKVGEYYVFQNRSHGYNGYVSKTVIGRDVVVNAPDFWLSQDWDNYHTHYPWLRVYGTINVYGLVNCIVSGNRNSLNEIFDTAVVTINGPSMFRDNCRKDNTTYTFNNQGFELRIYGGTFYLPAEAATRQFWTSDYTEEYKVGNVTYTPVELNDKTKDKIKIDGGSFILPDNAVPAIADYLTEDYVSMMHVGGNGILKHDNDSTYYVPYHTRVGYRFVFSKYSEGQLGTLTVTDLFKSLSVTYKYDVSKNEDGTVLTAINVYEGREVTEKAEDGTETTTVVYDVKTDDFSFDFGLNSILFTNAEYSLDKKLYSFEADGKTLQTVVPADCEHSFTGEPVEANCQHAAYADYFCSACGYNAHFAWGEKVGHSYELVEHVEATLNARGSKTYICSDCGESAVRAYTVDPSNFDVSVTLRHDDGTFEDVTVKASEIFEFSTTGSGEDLIYSVSAIKAFGENNVRNIYGITIPQGILYFNIAVQNYEKFENAEYGVANLTIAENATVNILNIGNLRRIEKIVVGKNTNVIFGASCSWYSPNNEQRKTNILSTIDMSAGNHSVKFVSACFEGRETVKNVIFGENATYDFGSKTFYNCAIESLEFLTSSEYIFTGTQSFYGNDMTELVFPDNFDFTFAQSTFENCSNLTSVTFGENSNYDIGNYTFLYCPIPKVVLTANSTYVINNRAFINEKLTELDMSAGNMNVTLNGAAFHCWQSNKKFCELTTIKFGENSYYLISKESLNDASITSLTLAPNSEYVFKSYCINGTDNKATFKTVDASADNIIVTFDSEAFRDKGGLEELLVNGKNSTYKFNGHSFYKTKVKELILGENSTYEIGNCFEGSLIETLDASADGITLTTSNWSFGRSTFKNLLINGKNGNYTFKSESFRNSIVESITLGEGSTYVFENNSFQSVNTLTSIDASANNISLTIKDYTFADKTTLAVLDISGENGTYDIGRETFRKSAITELKLGEGSTYTFGYRCFYGGTAMERVDFGASNVNATIASQFLNDCKTVKYIAFGENSTYSIGEFAFNNCRAENPIVFSNTSAFSIGKRAFYANAFESIVFEDDIDVTFTGVEAFQDCTRTKYLYLGKSFQLDNYPFKRLKDLEKLVLMDGVKFKDDQTEEWFFEYMGCSDFSSPIVVYNHSTDMVFPRGTFNECDGIILYTVTKDIGTNNEVFRSCTDQNGNKGFTVILGIPHALKVGPNVEPTCTLAGGTTWMGDGCDCGILYRGETLNINVYENKHNIKEDTQPARVDTYLISPIEPLGHLKGALITIEYENGYLAAGVGKYDCERCLNEEGNYVEVANPIFESCGYSVSTFLDKPSMTQGFIVNHDAYVDYLDVEPSFTFGVVAMGNASGETKQPLKLEKGAVVAEKNAIIGKTNYNGVGYFEIKVCGISESSENKNMIFCAYISNGKSISYIENGEIKDNAVGISYSYLSAK